MQRILEWGMGHMLEHIASIRSFPLRGRRVLTELLERRALRLLGACVGLVLLGFLLAGGSIAGRALPFAVGLIAAAASPLWAVPALLGASLGSVFFWGAGGEVASLVVGLLVFSAVCIAGRAGLRLSPWLMPTLTALLSLLVGLLFLVQARFAPETVLCFTARIAVASISAWAFARARTRDPPFLLYVLFCALSGASALPLPGGIVLGQVLAVMASAASVGTPPALLLATISGLAVDLACMPPISMTALFCFASLAASVLPTSLRPAQSLAYLAAVFVGVLFTGGQMPELIPATALGCCLSLLVPRALFLGRDGHGAVRRRLEQAAQVLSELGATLDGPVAKEGGVAEVFDRASDRVCGTCVLWSQCWQRRSTETYRALCAAAGPIVERGAAIAEDFPAPFAENCCHLDEFTVAIDRELDRQAALRQFHSRLRELRTVLAEQYECASTLFRQAAGSLGARRAAGLYFTAELGIGAAGKGGNAVSGDRGACFQTEEGSYYLLLCDGMGVGAEAAAESRHAIRTLVGLLQAGQDPRRALETLNGAYLLRGDGGFSTVDLLEASLVTGQATLYKWGAAPSYFKTAQETRQIGTAGPPPGFGVGHKAEEFRLSLREGELLVLLSDGAGGEEAGRRIASWGDGGPKALAAALIDGTGADGEDDRTAVVFRLVRRPPGLRYHIR